MNVEQILNEFETDQTKLMNNEQLQRFVLLQQLHFLTVQRNRLSHNNIDNGKNISFELIGFEDEIEGVLPTNTKE